MSSTFSDWQHISKYQRDIVINILFQLIKTRTAHAFLLLVISQVLHSIEEILFRLYNFLPERNSMADSINLIRGKLHINGDVFAVMNLVFIALLFLLSIQLYRQKSRVLPAAMVLAFIEFFNGLSHLSAMLFFRQYFPGCVTAFLLMAFSTLFVAQRWKWE